MKSKTTFPSNLFERRNYPLGFPRFADSKEIETEIIQVSQINIVKNSNELKILVVIEASLLELELFVPNRGLDLKPLF